MPFGLRRAVVIVGLLAWCAGTASAADLLSKIYHFKSGVTLEVGAATDNGVRLDSVQFEVPEPVDGKITSTRSVVRSEVLISNTGEAPQRVGVAIALYDAEGILLGVASGGSALSRLKPGRQQSFKLVFDYVYAQIHRAATFQISVESKW